LPCAPGRKPVWTPPPLEQTLFTPECETGIFQIGFRLGHLRLRRREIRFRLLNLVASLLFLKFQVGFRLVYLGGGLLLAVRVKGHVRLPLLGLNERQQVAGFDLVALLYKKFLEAALDL